MKLGEALVEERLITSQQLDEALKRQVQCWGRIGTNFVELGFLDEAELSQFLSRFFKMPAVTPKMLDSIPEDVINSIDKEAVGKYMILPFKKVRNRLYAAMLNPKNVEEIDKLSLKTGFHIVPYAITELRLLYSIEKYYGIKHGGRYISLRDLSGPDIGVGETAMNNIKAALANTMETEDVGRILINESYRIAKRVALFTVKAGKIRGWKAKGVDIDRFEMMENDSPIFSEVIKKGHNYRGPIPNTKGNEHLIKLLSGTPRDALILPINVKWKTVAILYADNGNTSVLDANVGFLSMLSSIAAIAFEIPILRKRIMSFSSPS